MHLIRTSNHLRHRTAGRVCTTVRHCIVRVQARHFLQLWHFLVAQNLGQLGCLFLRSRSKWIVHSHGHRRWCHRHGTDKGLEKSQAALSQCAWPIPGEGLGHSTAGSEASQSQPFLCTGGRLFPSPRAILLGGAISFRGNSPETVSPAPLDGGGVGFGFARANPNASFKNGSELVYPKLK